MLQPFALLYIVRYTAHITKKINENQFVQYLLPNKEIWLLTGIISQLEVGNHQYSTSDSLYKKQTSVKCWPYEQQFLMLANQEHMWKPPCISITNWIHICLWQLHVSLNNDLHIQAVTSDEILRSHTNMLSSLVAIHYKVTQTASQMQIKQDI